MTSPAGGDFDDIEVTDEDLADLDAAPPETPAQPTTPASDAGSPAAPAPAVDADKPDSPAPGDQTSAPAPAPETSPPPAIAWQPPPGGKPWTLRVDRGEFPIEGAVEYPQGVFIPRGSAFDSLRSRFLGNREAWQAERSQLLNAVKAAKEANWEEVARARATLDGVGEVLKGGPEAVAKWLENLAVNAPLLQERVARRVAEERAQKLLALEEERRAEEMAAELRPRLQHHLGACVEAVLGRPDNVGLLTAEEAQDLLRFLMEHGDRLYYEAGEGDPTGLAPGQLGFREEVFTSLVDRELRRARKYKDDVVAIEAAAKRNAAVTAEPVAPPPAQTKPAPPQTGERPRNADGTFAAAKKGLKAWKQDLDEENWDTLFEES